MDEEIGVDVVIDDEQESIATETSIDALKGDKGDKGDTGDRGPAGPQGERGIQGERGPAGPTGPQGETGPVGPAGERGPVGPIGPTGPTGATGPAGPQGIQGEQGVAGADGYSPTVETSKSGKTTTITITDAQATHTATILDGNDGADGSDGSDGFSPTVETSKDGKTTTISITDAETTHTATILDGNDGSDGADGEDGFSPIITTSKSGKTTTITIVDAEGTKTATILDGQDGQGSGDMLKSVYDTDDDGVVDNAEKVNNHTVAKDVPADAVFTDANAVWGNITGTLSNQTDLNTALGGKADASSLSAVATSGSYADLSNKPTIPSKISDLQNDSNFISTSSTAGLVKNDGTIDSSNYITGMTILTYGTSTWQDFLNAYNANKVVYTKVNGRMAFMAYVSLSGSTPTSVEFQYYRSMSSPTYSAQSDEVYVYKLTSAGAWTTTTRQASTNTTITADTGIEYTYTANGRTLELKGIQRATMPTASSSNVGKIYQFVGTTTSNYTQGYFYKCVNNSGTYSWQQINVQPTGGGGGSSIVDDEGDPVATMTLHNDPDDTDDSGVYSSRYMEHEYKDMILAEMPPNVADNHRNVYRGHDITSYFLSGQLSDDIAMGNFSNVYIGDFIDCGHIIYEVADINYYLRTGSQMSECIDNHLILVPADNMGTGGMMQYGQGGMAYTQTYMYQQGLTNIIQQIEADLGPQHLLPVEKILPSANSGGATYQTTTANRAVDLMSEAQVFGARFYADDVNGMNVSDHKSYDIEQLALFRLKPSAKITGFRESWWLRDCMDQQDHFPIVRYDGTPSYEQNTSNSIGIRPTIVVF